eukprot:GILK01006697.1.p1 GENE.GILK01006697.1~~GILK01006697.1.p1  ORF type:complete len:918 (+),score=104.32 GILK01006697.1:147-2900(+)
MAKAMSSIADHPILESIKMFLGSDQGCLKRSDAVSFWESMSKPVFATIYVKELVTKLIDLEKASTPNAAAIQSIITSLYFVSLFCILNADSTLRGAKKKWEDHRRDVPRPHSTADDVLRTIFRKHLDEEDVTETLVVQCSILHSLSQITAMMGNQSISIETDAEGGEYSFVHACVQEGILYRNWQPKRVFDGIKAKLRTVPASIKVSPKLAETSLLALFHMLKNFLILNPISSREYLQSLLVDVEQFLCWPLPFGFVANDIAALIRAEMCAPGTALRKRFCREIDQLVDLAQPLHEAVSLNSVHVVLQPSQNLQHLVFQRLFGSQQATECNLHSVRQGLLLLTFETDLNIDEALYDAIYRLDPESVTRFYNEAQSIVTAVAAEEAEAQRPFRVTHLSLLRESIVSHASSLSTSSASRLIGKMSQPSTSTAAADVEHKTAMRRKSSKNFLRRGTGSSISRPSQSLDAATLVSLQSNSTFKLFRGMGRASADAAAIIDGSDKSIAAFESASFSRKYLPQLPPLAIKVWQCEALSSTGFHTSATDSSSRYVPGPLSSQLEAILVQHQSFRLANGLSNVSTVKLLIAGDDSDLHRMVCAYAYLLFQAPDLFNNVDVRFYIVPVGMNHLAQYLAQNDGWYRRHIFTPFSSHPLLPATSPGDNPELRPPLPPRDQELLAKERIILPTRALTTLLHDYLRTAENVHLLRVFDCQCWIQYPEDNHSGLPDVAIPFLQRVELGVHAAARAHQRATPKHFKETSSLQEVIDHKSFKFAPLEWKIKYCESNLFGLGSSATCEELRGYQSIVLSHVPRSEDKGCPSIGSSDSLEVAMLSGDASKQEAALLKKKRGRVQSDVGASMSAFWDTYHVTWMEVRSMDRKKPFELLIDGELYGPFNTVRIAGSRGNKTAANMTFPVVTFFPVDS